jgi:hypothetical protein
MISETRLRISVLLVTSLVISSNLVLALVIGPHTLSSARVPDEIFYVAFFAAIFTSSLPLLVKAFIPRKNALAEDRELPP